MSPRIRTAVVAVAALALTVPLTVSAGTADAATYHFKNCTALHKKFPHGVGRTKAHDHVRGSTRPVTTFKRSTKIYTKVIAYRAGLDRDKDGVACEKR